jgi:hypothetical protein
MHDANVTIFSYKKQVNKKKKQKMAMAEENEFYSKLYVAGIFRGPVEEKSEEEIDLPGKDKFSYNIAAILARDREVVAVYFRVISDGCEISIAKNSFWLDKDREYVEKIKETLTNVSKYAPTKFEQACDREDMRDLFLTIKKYCFEKLEYILDKLRRDGKIHYIRGLLQVK